MSGVDERPTVAVIGGGITGLATAWALAKPAGAPRVVVFESAPAFGGKLRTSVIGGLAVDEGADAFLARVPEAVALCRELGMADELVSPATGRAYLWWDGTMHTLPEGLVLGVPAGLGGLARGRLLTTAGKARAALEPLLPRWFGLDRRDPDALDNLGGLVRRRFGDEVLERLVDPLVGGINAGDADHLSLRAAAPQIADVAARSRSLLVGLRARAADTRGSAAHTAPVFLAPRGGMASLVHRLVGGLESLGVELRAGHAVTTLAPSTAGRWMLDGGGGITAADAVVVAAPAFVAAPLLATAAPTAATLIGSIDHASVALVTFTFEERHVGRRLDGSGFLVPKPQQRSMTACSWASTKWAHWKLPGQVVVRVSLGRYGNEGGADGTDAEVAARALDELRVPIDLRGRPTETRVTRWPSGFPQHQPGHLDLVDRIDARLAVEAPGVFVAGAAYRGVGIPACIRQGIAAAARATAHLAARPPAGS